MTTPSGSPAWTRTATHTIYGGNLNKRNLLSVGAIDAQTDLTAEQLARIAADLAAIVNVAPFMVIRYTNNDTSPAAPTIQSIYGQTGVVTTPYAGDTPPTGFPSAARNGNGDVTFTFASSYTDPYGVSGSHSLGMALLTASSSSARQTTYETVGGTGIRCHIYNGTGTATTDDTATLMVW